MSTAPDEASDDGSPVAASAAADAAAPTSIDDPAVRERLRAAKGLLICDACSLLDLLQDPWDDGFDARRRPIARDLLAREAEGELVALAPERVLVEIDRHAGRLLDKAGKSLEAVERRHLDRYRALEQAAVATAPSEIDVDAWLALVEDALRSWRSALVPVPTSDAARLRALGRVDRHDAPSAWGKPEVWDCVIVETVLETTAGLRADGIDCPGVFLSSNVADYRSSRGDGPYRAREPLQAEFDALGLRYAWEFGQARERLFP